MNKRLAIYSFLLMSFLPVMFQGPHEELSLGSYLVKCFMPLMILIVFWLNYLYLVPKAIKEDNIKRLVLINLVLVIVICVTLIGWHWLEMNYFNQLNHVEPRRPHSAPPAHPGMMSRPRPFDDMRMSHEEHSTFFILAAIRDCINIILGIFIAYTIRMSQHISFLHQKQQEAEVARRDAELKGLRNQISPHFLLNTLNNIYALSPISAERTQNAVMQLSRMLRHMLYDNQDEMVTLYSESQFIESYIELMRLRLSSNVVVESHIEISEDSNTLVAPLLFISLVENAFKHGVSASEKCFVSITLDETNETIHCLIRNSNHPKTQSDRSGHGIGLQNVQSRLDMIYHGRYVWHKGVEGTEYISEITISK